MKKDNKEKKNKKKLLVVGTIGLLTVLGGTLAYFTTSTNITNVFQLILEKGIKYHKFDTIINDNVLRLLSIGGKDQVPFLYNEETNDKLYESDEIIKYLSNYEQE